MTRHPRFGLFLALAGALVLTPDTLLMRLSGMDGFQMVGWRGLSMGGVMLLIWVATSNSLARDLGYLTSGAAIAVIACQYVNATLFSLAVAAAPVSIVLFCVATVPVFAAILARIVFGEPTRRATWIAIVVVLFGIGVAVFGDKANGAGLNVGSLLGALAGLGVAAALALNFVVLRHSRQVPLPAAIGIGAILAGITGVLVTGPDLMLTGNLTMILVTGLLILPFSFGALSLASRYTHASNVSLIMLLETVLGPLWVWWGLNETLTPMMFLGGVIVVVSLAIYIIHTSLRRSVPKADLG